jgi:cobalt/nickel transport system permease protein
MPATAIHRGFVEKTLTSLLHAMERASSSERIAEKHGALQGVDARVKLLGCLALIVAAAVSRHLDTLSILFAAVVALSLVSRVPLNILSRAWAIIFLFTAAIALPALFTTPGQTIATLAGLPVTLQGLRAAGFLMARVESATTLGLLLVATTPWAEIIAALRSLRVPAAVVLIIAMTYRYVFVLLRSAEEMFVARRSRSVGRLEGPARRRMATSTAGVLLGKALALADDVYLAMLSRGFRGEVHVLDELRMRRRDWYAATLFTAAALVAFWQGLR